MEHRAQPLGDHAVEMAYAVRAARHQAQQSAARHEPARGEILDLPAGDLFDPVGQLRRAFGRTGSATGFEDAGDRRR
jgi:hypothetical protein